MTWSDFLGYDSFVILNPCKKGEEVLETQFVVISTISKLPLPTIIS